MGKSGIVNRVEPSILEHIDASSKERLQKSGFYQFLQKFSGENYGMALAFAQSSDGKQVSVSSLKFKITESFIAEAMGLPMTGEKWYKKKTMRIGEFSAFLKPQFTMVDWRCGIPSSWLKEDWQPILRVV